MSSRSIWQSAMACVLAAAIALCAGCGQHVENELSLPASFGSIEKQMWGCSSVQGVYSWPPIEGMYANKGPTNRQPWEGGIPVPIYGSEMQIWIKQERGAIEIRSRLINRQANVRNKLTREWSYATYAGPDFACRKGVLDFKAQDVESTEDFGGKGIRRGFVLARLNDGSLAVGIKTISYGRTTSVYSWADQPHGTIDAPDKIFWSWSKLSLMGPGDAEPEPIDANQSM